MDNSGNQAPNSSHCALLNSIQANDLKLLQSILEKHPEDVLYKDENGHDAMYFAREHSDPSYELLLLSDSQVKVQNCFDKEFIETMKDSIMQEMNEGRKYFSYNIATMYNLSEVLIKLMKTERKVVRFGEFIHQKTEFVKNRLTALNEKPKEKSPLAKNYQDLFNQWENKIKESENINKSFESKVHTPESKEALQRWQQYLNERKNFFREFISKTESFRDDSHIEEEIALNTRVSEALNHLKNWDRSQTQPFQKELVEFTRQIRAAHKQNLILRNPDEALGNAQRLNTQIALTNPQLFEPTTTK